MIRKDNIDSLLYHIRLMMYHINIYSDNNISDYAILQIVKQIQEMYSNWLYR